MTIDPSVHLPPGRSARRTRPPRTAFIVVLAAVAAVGGCGLTGWYVGLFASDGRFAELDACTLLPPPVELAPLVMNGAREPADSRPKTLFGIGDGDATSECKWSTVPAGRDNPFRTVRIHAETKIHSGRVSAETRAREALAGSYSNATRRQGAQPKQVDLGEQGYSATDTMEIQILFSHTVIYDLHAKFRISNALVDVSARTHTAPSDQDMALVLGLAKTVADRLDSTN